MAGMSAAVLVLNAGSSSLKFSLYGAAADALLCRGQIAAAAGVVTLRATYPVAH
jgi:acetate kinase